MNIASIRLESRVLFMHTDISVLLPEGALPCGDKLKVLWLLHGASGDHRSYLYSADLAGYMRRHPCMIVMPSALNSDFGKYEQFGTGYDFPAYFFDELMPFVRASFPASCRREDNYIVGASMGGYGAMSLGLMRPELFAAIGMLGASMRECPFLKGYEDMDSASFRALALADPAAFPTEYGDPTAGIKLKEINVITKYPTIRAFLDSPECMWRRFPEVAAAGELPDIYAACGSKDLFFEPNMRFKRLVEELGLQNKVTFSFAEGVGHEQAFFNGEIGRFMDHCGI